MNKIRVILIIPSILRSKFIVEEKESNKQNLKEIIERYDKNIKDIKIKKNGIDIYIMK